MNFIFPSALILFLYCLLSCASSGPAGTGSRLDSAAVTSQAPGEEYYKPQNIRFDNHRYEPTLGTVQLLMADEGAVTQPVIPLGAGLQLSLLFDDLTANYRNLSYTFIHCTADWKKSDLSENEYLTGFFQNFITDYKYSFNTRKSYISYRVDFPNQEIKITKSGNYIILVFENDKEHPVLTRRFMVYEDEVRVDAKVTRPSINAYRFYKHEIDFTINTMNLQVNNPFAEIKPVILQNFRWDNAISGLQPLFVKDTELIYDYDDKNNFPGGNEYRRFDIRTFRFHTEFIRDIKMTDSLYYVQLLTDKPRSFLRYVNDQDINGHYLVKNYEGGDDRTEADYARVFFTLDKPIPVPDAQIYIFGELSDWKFRDEFKMFHDPATGHYTANVLLKQGYYNYQYLALPDSSGAGDLMPIEGMHFDNEIPYAVLVYFRSITGRYDRLVGMTVVSSRAQ